MALKYLSLKNEMEQALKEIPEGSKGSELCECCGQYIIIERVDPKSGKGWKVPEDVRVGESAAEEMKRNVEAYIRAITKFAFTLKGRMTKRTTLKEDEIKIAVGAIKRADIEREIR